MRFDYDEEAATFTFEEGDGEMLRSWTVALWAIQTMTLAPYGEGHIATSSDSYILFEPDLETWHKARSLWLAWRRKR